MAQGKGNRAPSLPREVPQGISMGFYKAEKVRSQINLIWLYRGEPAHHQRDISGHCSCDPECLAHLRPRHEPCTVVKRSRLFQRTGSIAMARERCPFWDQPLQVGGIILGTPGSGKTRGKATGQFVPVATRWS